MSLEDELRKYVNDTIEQQWTMRNGRKVPDAETLALSNVGVKIDATVLYADLADSTALVADYPAYFASEVYKTYLYCASRLIRNSGGTICAFDGDRVMGIFHGDSKNTSAVRCALNIAWAAENVIRPRLKQQYSTRFKYLMKQKVGVDTSKLVATQTGVRGDHDLVWVGTAANNAAKLAARKDGYSTYITDRVRSAMHKSVRFYPQGGGSEDMWKYLNRTQGQDVYGSHWWLRP